MATERGIVLVFLRVSVAGRPAMLSSARPVRVSTILSSTTAFQPFDVFFGSLRLE